MFDRGRAVVPLKNKMNLLLLRISSYALVVGIVQTCAFGRGSNPKPEGNAVHDEHRREFLSGMLLTTAVSVRPFQANADAARRDATQKNIGILDPNLRDYYDTSLPDWKGTSLPGPLSLSEACARLVDSGPVLNMGRWPDPILRHPAAKIPLSVFQNKHQLEQLQLVATALSNTAWKEGAVGLAAQQCGLDASLIYMKGANSVKSIRNVRDERWTKILFGDVSREEVLGEGTYDRFMKRPIQSSQQHQEENGIFLVNPRIIHRSPESDMMVWTEQCLVLPPEFRASLLRDAEVTIEYESLDYKDIGLTKQIKLRGESARCAQHEIDHDHGILIVDHVSLDELLSIDGKALMADIENADGLHPRRMQRAYSREVFESSLLPRGQKMVALAMEDNMDQEKSQSSSPIITKRTQYSPSHPVTVETSAVCDKYCLEERKRVVKQRRAMMQQSRSNTRRADVLELSQQRASLYGTEFQGVPPQLCSGFCP